MDYNLSETAYQRACKDTKFYFGTIRFWVFELLITAGLTIWVLLWTPNFTEEWYRIMYQILVPVSGAISGLGIVFLFSLVVAPLKQRNEARIELYKISSDEISKVIDQLSTITINTANAQENYANMLVKCSGKLSVGGIGIDRSPPTVYSDVRGNVIPPVRDRYGMTYYQKLEFLRQLRIDGIIDADYSESYEIFHLSEFGRRVVKRIKQVGNG